MLSRNSSDTGLRIRNSIEDHGLDISRAAFCGGESPHRYVKDFGKRKLYIEVFQKENLVEHLLWLKISKLMVLN